MGPVTTLWFSCFQVLGMFPSKCPTSNTFSLQEHLGGDGHSPTTNLSPLALLTTTETMLFISLSQSCPSHVPGTLFTRAGVMHWLSPIYNPSPPVIQLRLLVDLPTLLLFFSFFFILGWYPLFFLSIHFSSSNPSFTLGWAQVVIDQHKPSFL
ncbi:hypothetical protein PAXRUDRAFT_435614 [Paxillus rubicundulus Ve08.2h10]|uniref:Uncharacterized protein n=1 Tax=Paxillus rubicundulus Ve08.2h10 TaxID=930991 RepID=A0A0D0DQH6_9AGAM|nr:hypothetical protein PAXRUDRAFT_435614 [Paxillus rubicundulus Ve08.2h10]